jgi:hypothetical protein
MIAHGGRTSTCRHASYITSECMIIPTCAENSKVSLRMNEETKDLFIVGV